MLFVSLQRVSDLLWKSCLRLEFWLQVVQTLYRVSGMGDSAVARLTCTIAWLRSFRRNTWLLLSYEGTLRVWQWAPPLSRRWGQSRPLESIFRTSSLWKVFRDDKMEPAYARRGRDCITAIFAYDDAIANTENIISWFVELRSRNIRSTIGHAPWCHPTSLQPMTRNRISCSLREKIRGHRSNIVSPDLTLVGHQDAGLVLFKILRSWVPPSSCWWVET